jgi:hypothetical protein
MVCCSTFVNSGASVTEASHDGRREVDDAIQILVIDLVSRIRRQDESAARR